MGTVRFGSDSLRVRLENFVAGNGVLRARQRRGTRQ